MEKWRLLDLEKHLGFFRAYHSHPANSLLHILTVWPIFFTILLLLYFTPPFFPLPASVASYLPLVLSRHLAFNISLFLTIFYAVFYVILDIRAGSLTALLFVLSWAGSNVLGGELGFSFSWKIVAVTHSICWTSQYIGHAAFEKRSPEPRDNIFQAFLLSPFLIVFEVLERIGYEPYPGFRAGALAMKEAEGKAWEERNKHKSH